MNFYCMKLPLLLQVPLFIYPFVLILPGDKIAVVMKSEAFFLKFYSVSGTLLLVVFFFLEAFFFAVGLALGFALFLTSKDIKG